MPRIDFDKMAREIAKNALSIVFGGRAPTVIGPSRHCRIVWLRFGCPDDVIRSAEAAKDGDSQLKATIRSYAERAATELFETTFKGLDDQYALTDTEEQMIKRAGHSAGNQDLFMFSVAIGYVVIGAKVA